MKENLVQAYVYYTLAKRNNQSDATMRLSELKQRMTATEIERANSLVAAASSKS
jgi:hypothetical protein